MSYLCADACLVVVGLHLLVEDLGLAGARGADEVAVQQAQDRVADLLELVLHLPAVLLGVLGLLLVALGLLLRENNTYMYIYIYIY